jgi:integrase
LQNADVKWRALVLFLVSSGVRIGDTVSLKDSHVELSANPPIVRVRREYTKEGDNFTTFISKEAKLALQEWL